MRLLFCTIFLFIITIELSQIGALVERIANHVAP
jgi:hypothetical protein